MRVFFSHSSFQKPLVRELRGHLPNFLISWIDEERLLFGDHITLSIESAIKTESDYVLLFIDDHAVSSAWVRKEVDWALEAEKKHNRTILLPIVIEKPALEKLENVELRNRKYLHLQDFQETSVRALARALSDSLFALICRDMHELHSPGVQTTLTKIADADSLLSAQANIIQKVVFPYRRANPMSVACLLEAVNSNNDESINEIELDRILTTLLQRNIIPGLMYDGYEAFVTEEHAKWKSEVHRAAKERVARRAMSHIRSGMKLFFDAGSTVEEVVRLLCKKIETRALGGLTVVSTSVNSTDMVSDCCVKMGFDDESSAIELHIPGGQIRHSTQAIVPHPGKEPRDLVQIAATLGPFDLAFLGVNGIDADLGFTTEGAAENQNKTDMIAGSRSAIILGDSSKVGLVLPHRFAGFDPGITLFLDDDPKNNALKTLVERCNKYITLV